jgi:hypothetical protein
MPIPRQTARFALATLLLTGTSVVPAAAGRAEMALPDHLTNADILEVSKRKSFFLPKRQVDDALVFGNYHVMAYRQGWNHRTTHGFGAGRLGVYQTKDWAKFEFNLTGPTEAPIAVQCVKSGEERGLRYATRSSDTRLGPVVAQDLDCDLEVGEEVWQLALAFDQGELRGPAGQLYTVTPTNAVAGTPVRVPTPTGFLLSAGGPAVSAVDLFGHRFVFARDLEPAARQLLAAAEAALALADRL